MYNPRYKEQVNENNRRPSTLFSEENKDLAKEGERWMKHATASSMIAGTLIAAAMFTTAFQVPGGTDDEIELPIMLETDRYAFFTFMLSNGPSMFTSLTSLLIDVFRNPHYTMHIKLMIL